ncbi:MAG: hypothetical protein FWE82_06360 [Defluviitaleaceae bacterium]|nr:hypothetical protein [Defluviitaleaceae bacterium]
MFSVKTPKKIKTEISHENVNQEADAFSSAKFILCDMKNKAVQINVWAEIDNGCLKISGQEFGAAVNGFFNADEYEYFYTFDKKNTELLINLSLKKKCEDMPPLIKAELFKMHLLEKYSDADGCKRLKNFCDENGIEYKFFNYF